MVFTSNWVLQPVEQIRHIVGLSYESFEEELVAIEVGQLEQVLASCSSFGDKGNRELIRFVCFINYDVNNGSACHGRVKGEGC